MSKSQTVETKVSNIDGRLTGIRIKDFQYTVLGKLILHRLFNNRDVKILITSSGNTTGTGKTTLAIILSRIISKYSAEIFNRKFNWNANDNSFMNVYEYLQKYKNANKGEVLITDELEFLADKRRSMSNENVYFSQAWQMLRYKNAITIGTAPSMANLDKRIPENTDIWINVMFPGFAYVYYVSMDDFTGKIEFKRLKMLGLAEIIKWKPIDNDEDYQILKKKKEEIGIPGIDENEQYDKEDIEQREKKTEKELVKDFTVRLLKEKENGNISFSQEEIGELVDRSQQYVSKIKRQEITG